MPRQQYRDRTISFYEVVLDQQGVHQQIDELPWQDFLEDLEDVELGDRSFDLDRTVIGAAVFQGHQRHLLLHKVKSEHDWMSAFDRKAGTIEEVEISASKGYLDTSVVVFSGTNNIIAMMEGSTSAPTQKTLQLWLNEFKPFNGLDLVVRPIMSQAEVTKLHEASGIQRAEFKVKGGQAHALGKAGGRLAKALYSLSEHYGDATVTVAVSIPRRKRGEGNGDPQAELYDDVRALEPALDKATRARVGLLFMDDDEYGKARLTELVEHHVTAKVRVAAVDAQGRSVRILGAITIMTGRCEEQLPELVRSVVGAG